MLFRQRVRFSYEISCGGLNIDSISPTKGSVDSLVTINGTGFGTATDTRAVYFNGLKATTVTFVSDTQAMAKVPANASSGDVVVDVNGQRHPVAELQRHVDVDHRASHSELQGRQRNGVELFGELPVTGAGKKREKSGC